MQNAACCLVSTWRAQHEVIVMYNARTSCNIKSCKRYKLTTTGCDFNEIPNVRLWLDSIGARVRKAQKTKFRCFIIFLQVFVGYSFEAKHMQVFNNGFGTHDLSTLARKQRDDTRSITHHSASPHWSSEIRICCSKRVIHKKLFNEGFSQNRHIHMRAQIQRYDKNSSKHRDIIVPHLIAGSRNFGFWSLNDVPVGKLRRVERLSFLRRVEHHRVLHKVFKTRLDCK